MAFGVSLIVVFSIICSLQRNECVQFPEADKLGLVRQDGKQNGKRVVEKKPLEERMKEVSRMLQDVSKECIEIKQSKGAAHKMPKMKNSMEEMGRQLKEATYRLQEQCRRSDEQNSALLALLDGRGSLKFENAAMSSVYEDFLPSRAIDGDKNPNMLENSCAHSGVGSPESWWLGELSERSRISRVELTNRADCCAFRMNNISVEVFETDPRTNTDAEPQLCGKIYWDPQRLVKVECEQPIWGKYLRVIKHSKEVLQLCEVEAFDYTHSKKLGMSVQSSEVAAAHLATDGDQTTCSETRNYPGTESWWQVDIKDGTTVTGVSITNRNDEKYTFLSDFKVSVHKTFPSVCEDSDNTVCTHHKGTVGKGETVIVACEKQMVGRFLRITKVNGGMLSLCDVIVL